MTAPACPATPTSLRLTQTAVAFALGLLLILVLAGPAKAAAFGFAAAPAPAGLSSNCQAGTGADALKVTCTFGAARNVALSVGPNVNKADVRAVGAPGGRPTSLTYTRAVGAPGGRGADVSGLINFPAGATLFVNVGELEGPQGEVPGPSNSYGGICGGCNPWSFGGGAPAGDKCALAECSYGQNGGGGGASDIRTVSPDQAGTLESRLIVGGGGGGGGGIQLNGSVSGAGGDAGQPGQTGGATESAGGGAAGTASAGGAGGYTAPFPQWEEKSGYGGGLGSGGPGGQALNWSGDTGGGGGGGGGGGLYGGGGGGGGTNSGGGGGGSSLVPAGGAFAVSDTSSGSVRVAYERAATTTTVTSSSATSVYGNDITLTAAVRSDAGALDGGTVQFYDGATALGAPQTVNPATGDATLTTRALRGEQHTLTAIYGGDAGYAPSTAGGLSHTVTADSTATTLDVSSASSSYSNPATLTATVTAASGAPVSGQVQFYDGDSALLDPVDVTNGTAVLSLRGALSFEEHTLHAVYVGDASTATSQSNTVTHTAIGDNSTTTLAVSAATSSYNSPATLTATVLTTAGAPVSIGQVQFYDGANTFGAPVSVSNGTATLTLRGNLSAGEHTLHAAYLGDPGTSTSESSTVTHTAMLEATNAELHTANYQTTVSYGQTISFRGGVRAVYNPYVQSNYYGYPFPCALNNYIYEAGYNADIGSVRLYDGAQLIDGQVSSMRNGGYPGSNPYSYGCYPGGGGGYNQYSFGSGVDDMYFTAPTPAGGLHDYRISFTGNAAFGAANSTSSYYTQVTVNNVPSSTTLQSSRTGSHLGQERTLSASVTLADGRAPMGSVQFTDNGAPLGAAQPVTGTDPVTLTTSELGLGEHDVRAVFTPTGDPYSLGSTSALVAQPVSTLTTSTTAAITPIKVQAGEALTLDASVAVQDAPLTGAGSEAATGTVTFSDGRTVLGTQPLGADGHARLDIPGGLAVGGHVINVAYSGDVNHAASSQDPAALVIGRVSTQVALTLPDTDGDQFVFRAQLTPVAYSSSATPTGDIAFYDGDTLLGRAPLTGMTATGPGVAELTLPALAVGGHAIQAVYEGDAQFAGDRSLARSVVVAAPTPNPGPTPDPVPTPVPTPPVVPPVPAVPVTPVTPVLPVATPALVLSGHIEIMSERRVQDGGFIRVRLHCDSSPKRRCVGTLALRVGTRNGARRDYRLTGGQARWVRVRVPASLLARVWHDRAARALVVADPTRQADDGSEPRSVRKRIVIVNSDD